MRPFPKLDIFGKTQKNTVSHPRQKELSTNKQQFAHIVSPVGTYMKKTASTPLMSTGKLINKNANILNTTAFRELEFESRLCQPMIGINASDLGNYNGTGLVSLPGCIGVPNTLPKKAYISSELKHVSIIESCVLLFPIVKVLFNVIISFFDNDNSVCLKQTNT